MIEITKADGVEFQGKLYECGRVEALPPSTEASILRQGWGVEAKPEPKPVKPRKPKLKAPTQPKIEKE